MTGERKTLLALMALVFLLGIYLFGTRPWLDRIKALEEKRDLMVKQLEKLDDLPPIQPMSSAGEESRISEILGQYKRQNLSMDLYPFGQSVKIHLQSLGFKIESYREIRQSSEEAILFHARASTLSLLRFLDSKEALGMDIRSLTVNAQIQPAQVDLKIALPTLPDGFSKEWQRELDSMGAYGTAPRPYFSRETSPGRLSDIFFLPPRVEARPEETSAPAEVPHESEIDRNSLQFIGTVSSGSNQLYFKNRSTNRIIALSPDGSENEGGWKLIKIKDTMFTLKKDDLIYEVKR
jgi:type II secretory pathway component PulM